MAKKFQKKYMHPTRRKLVDMIQTGKYETNTSIGWNKKTETHEIGDVWVDEHNRYEQKDGYILKTSKNSEAFQEIRDYIQGQNKCRNTECKRIKKSKNDRKLIQKTGYCIDCLAVIETEIKLKGIWQEYQNYRIWTRMIVHGKIKLEQIQQAHDEAKQVYDFVNEDGTLEKWTMPQSVEDVKADMLKMIESGKEELKEIEIKRNEVFEILKNQNYEHFL